jgi:hypothetical protein
MLLHAARAHALLVLPAAQAGLGGCLGDGPRRRACLAYPRLAAGIAPAQSGHETELPRKHTGDRAQPKRLLVVCMLVGRLHAGRVDAPRPATMHSAIRRRQQGVVRPKSPWPWRAQQRVRSAVPACHAAHEAPVLQQLHSPVQHNTTLDTSPWGIRWSSAHSCCSSCSHASAGPARVSSCCASGAPSAAWWAHAKGQAAHTAGSHPAALAPHASSRPSWPAAATCARHLRVS